MIEKGDYRQIRDALLAAVSAVETEEAALEAAAGRVLAQEAAAAQDVPSFARSPYDGYAFRAEDVRNASAELPVTLRIVDYIPAGEMPHMKIDAGTAAHLMTGAPVPEGADAVLPFEKTLFTDKTVTIREPVPQGSNVILPGEDIRKGTVLAHAGMRIDAGLAGVLAGQGIFRPRVYRRPLVGVISTGAEILEEGDILQPGKIYNSNRYSLQAACAEAGCRSIYLGTARDDVEEICGMLRQALASCDAVLLSGGVSVGDFDCTPAAMELAGVKLLARGAALKPGMAGAYGIYFQDRQAADFHPRKKDAAAEPDSSAQREPEGKEADIRDGIPVMALSGNPAACMTAFFAIALPVLKKRMGLRKVLPLTFKACLEKEYQRKNQSDRLLRGMVDLAGSVQKMRIFPKQGNQVLSTLAGANAFALIPAGAQVKAGEPVEAFLME